MLKLVIADDERVIRETISKQIDWKSLDIELVGLCKDGIEAYNMILDETPDIVMTDIRMPGLSGLELAKRITQTDRQIQFIFLSGYEEFDYVREAMSYGARHYLLKPCSEEKLIESIRQASRDCLQAQKQEEERLRQNEMKWTIYQDTMYHLIMDGIALDDVKKGELKEKLEELMEVYGRYLEFDKGSCYLYYVYFLEEQCLEAFLKKLEAYNSQMENSCIFYGVYVKNTLLLFSREGGQKELLKSCLRQEGAVEEIEEEYCQSLLELLGTVLSKIRRYDMVYPIHNFRATAMVNDQNAMRYIQNIYRQLEENEEESRRKCKSELLSMTRGASKPEYLQLLGNSICTQFVHMGVCSVQEMTGFIRAVSQEKEITILRKMIEKMILQAMAELENKKQDYGVLPQRVMEYVETHLSDAELTLKKIAEEYLYMNVDYVSRQFRKSTGKKFSQYLTEQRVKRAKELLAEEDSSKVQYVAECVGCGNNPQYFSQIFKKIEGVTPGKWAAQAHGKEKNSFVSGRKVALLNRVVGFHGLEKSAALFII